MQIVVTGMPVPIMNGVWVVGQEADSETVDASLNMVKDAKVPFCLQARPGWRAQGALIAKARQMVEFEEVPLTAVTGPVAADAPEDLSIRRLAPDEALLHCEIAGKAFGATTELFAQLMTDSVMRLRELRVYVGEVLDLRLGCCYSHPSWDLLGPIYFSPVHLRGEFDKHALSFSTRRAED